MILQPINSLQIHKVVIDEKILITSANSVYEVQEKVR